MKNIQKILMLSFVLFTVIPPAASKEKKQSFSVSYHPITVPIDLDFDSHDAQHNVKNKNYETVMGDFGYKAVGYDNLCYGALQMVYCRNIIDKIRLHLAASCELSSKHWDLYDVPDGPRTLRIPDYRISFLTGVDYIIALQEKTDWYLTEQFGVSWIHRGLDYLKGSQRNFYTLALQAWFGMNYHLTEALDLDLALGIGTLGFVKIGIVYDF